MGDAFTPLRPRRILNRLRQNFIIIKLNQSPAGLNSKPHYEILDGLRGVAAIIVLAFHLLEAHATNAFTQIINHGYLAVDFFFLLSGFVVGYAYDDRWGKMSS